MSMASEYGKLRAAAICRGAAGHLGDSSLTTSGPKPKVVFVRAGGPPLTQSMSFMGRMLVEFAAARLFFTNYDVWKRI